MPASRSWLRAAEVAARLHVSPKTIARWAKDGRLPCRRCPTGAPSAATAATTPSTSTSSCAPSPTGHSPPLEGASSCPDA
jgi:hypothetical protein